MNQAGQAGHVIVSDAIHLADESGGMSASSLNAGADSPRSSAGPAEPGGVSPTGSSPAGSFSASQMPAGTGAWHVRDRPAGGSPSGSSLEPLVEKEGEG
jgi:hypothetical protein